MAEGKKLNEDIAINKDFDLLTRSYQEHAIGQINFARYSVLYARSFAEDLAQIFANVKTAYLRSVMTNNIKTVVKKNGKDLWILVAANNKLYGDIILRTTKLFITKAKQSDPKRVDLVVIGQQGKNVIDQSGLDHPYEYIEIPDTNVTADFLKKLTDKLLFYENIYVFYGRYNNLISQTPIQVALSGEIPDIDPKDAVELRKQSYLFEPTLEEILSFFENQILSLLLNQTVQEAQLARFASRINAMETAQTNIQKQLEILRRSEKLLKARSMSKEQTELLAGRALWNRG
jgi:F-type H+-transporting ATPase subunit gamma